MKTTRKSKPPLVRFPWQNNNSADTPAPQLHKEGRLTRTVEELQQANARLESQVKERTRKVGQLARQLRALSSRFARVEQAERNRLAGILHDHIQQLLVAARMQIGLAKREPDSSTALAAIQSVDSILKEAITASRSLTVELSPPVLNEEGLVGGLQWLAGHMEERNNFKVTLSLDARAEPATEETRFLIFESVRELLFNALKHSGKPEACVTLSLMRNNRIKVIIEDHGCGFDVGKPPKSLNSFGLSSIQQRLAHLGGSVAIRSAPGQGTEIALTVPKGGVVRGGKKHADHAARENNSAVPGTKKIRVILADDHNIVRDGMASLLKMEPDIEVVGQAADGVEAVALAAKMHPDVVIMDVNMPRMNGVQAALNIRRFLPRARIVALSMHQDEHIVQSMLQAGATAYIAKGGPTEDLVAAIKGT